MNLWTAFLAILRRWYITLPLLLLTFVLAVRAADSVEATYTASASLLLVPATPDENPYSSFSNSVSVTAIAITEVGRGEAFRREVRAAGARGSYTVGVADDAPIIKVTGTSNRADRALETVETVVRLLGLELNERQVGAGAPAGSLLQFNPLDLPQRAQEETGDRTRVFVGVLALGVAAAVSAALLVEGIVTGRRSAAGAHTGRSRRTRARSEAA